MKKSLIILAAAVLALVLGAVSLAAPVTPNGIQATALMDFTNLEDGEKTFGDLGFWTGFFTKSNGQQRPCHYYSRGMGSFSQL